MSEEMRSLLGMALGVILVNNLVLGQLLGVGPFLEGSGSLRPGGGHDPGDGTHRGGQLAPQ